MFSFYFKIKRKRHVLPFANCTTTSYIVILDGWVTVALISDVNPFLQKAKLPEAFQICMWGFP